MDAAIREQQSPLPAEPERDPYYEELNRLFNLYRIANLNTRYYGIRAERFEWWNKSFLIVTATLSTLALAVILAADPKSANARIFAATCTGIAALVSGVTPFLGLTEKVRELRNLRFAYGQLFGQIEFAITEIKRVGILSGEQIGLARMVHEGFMRIETMDELEPDQKLIDREDAKVRQQFPPDYLWTHL
jgi:hypothetical protein